MSAGYLPQRFELSFQGRKFNVQPLRDNYYQSRPRRRRNQQSLFHPAGYISFATHIPRQRMALRRSRRRFSPAPFRKYTRSLYAAHSTDDRNRNAGCSLRPAIRVHCSKLLRDEPSLSFHLRPERVNQRPRNRQPATHWHRPISVHAQCSSLRATAHYDR